MSDPAPVYEAEIKANPDEREVIVAGARDPMILDPDTARQFAELLLLAADTAEGDQDGGQP